MRKKTRKAEEYEEGDDRAWSTGLVEQKRALLGETVRRLAIPFVSGCAALKEEEGK